MILKKSFLVIVLCSLYLFSFAEGKIILEIKKQAEDQEIRFMNPASFDVYITNKSDIPIKIVDPNKSDRFYKTHHAENIVQVNGKVEKSSWMVEGPMRKYSDKEIVILKPNESFKVDFIRVLPIDTAQYNVIVNYEQMINPLSEVVDALGQETIKNMALKLTAEISFKPVLPKVTIDNLDISYEEIVKPPQPSEVNPMSSVIKYSTYSLTEALSKDNWDLIYKVNVNADEIQIAHFLPMLKNLRWVYFNISNEDSIPSSLAHASKLMSVTVLVNSPKANEEPKPVYIEPLKGISGLVSLDLINTYNKNMPAWMGNFSKLENLFLINAFYEFGAELGNLTSLKNLTLTAGLKQSLPKELGLLKNLTNLEIRELYTPAPDGIFLSSKLENLELELFTEKLDLAGCQAKVIKITQRVESSAPFTGMKDLAHLNTLFWNSPSTAFPDLSNCNKLEHVKITNNKITSIPECLFLLPSLKRLNLECSNLSSLQENIGNMAALETLLLYKTKITSFPKEFANLKALKSLMFYKSTIDQVPEIWFALENLEVLLISETNISQIPEKISNFKSLKSLSLVSNKLSTLPKEIGDLGNLEELTLTGNEIISLPEEIGKLNKLKSLTLINNKLKSLPKSLYNLPALEKIYVNKNPLNGSTIAYLKQPSNKFSVRF